MTTWFVSRHPGAVQWAKRHGLAVDRWEAHIDAAEVHAGDTVVGSLPVHLAAAISLRGAHYVHLSLNMPAQMRGEELSADDLDRFGARLERYAVTPMATPA